MKILEFDELESTQNFLIARLKSGEICEETCILARAQNKGIGSRGNAWEGVERGLYFSFCVRAQNLSPDILPQSMSIFFGFLCKENLRARGSKVWLKYPNDLFLGNKKIGGIMSSIIDGFVVCGIGINLKSQNFAHLEENIITDSKFFLKQFFSAIKAHSWAQVFKKYSEEFPLNKNFSFHHNGKLISFQNAILLQDGAISVRGEKIYCAR